MLYAPEKFVKSYLNSRYAGPYSVIRAFSIEPYCIPSIVVRMGRVEEIEPNSGVFSGILSLAVVTQINDDTDPEGEHLETVNLVLDYFSGNNLANYSDESTAFTVELFYFDSSENGREENNLKTVLNYAITYRL